MTQLESAADFTTDTQTAKVSQKSFILDFIRHGIAQEWQEVIPDESRALTPAGIHRTREIAQVFKKLGFGWDSLLTSPLKRAVQTAEILQKAKLTPRVEIFEPLSPGGSPQHLLESLDLWQGQGSLALVGHQPDLSEWALQSIGIPAGQGQLGLKKAGLARVVFEQGSLVWGQGSLGLVLTPKVLLSL